MWECVCVCGKIHITYGNSLKAGRIKSCGCHRNKTHGLTKTPEHRIWCGIKDRCNNETNKAYRYYGGRGIFISQEWNNSFEQFLLDMGKKPSPNHSIERIDNDGNYCKENCKWATRKEQERNKRSNVFIETKWGKITLAEAAERTGIRPEIVYARRNRGWGMDRLLTPDRNNGTQ